MRLVFVIVVGLALLASIASAADSYAPTYVVFARTSAQGATVAWLPGDELADSYRVYGIDETGTRHSLAVVNVATLANGSASLDVDGGYVTYAVAGVLGGIESPMTMGAAVVGGRDPCVYVSPPDVVVSCLPVVGNATI